MKFNFKAAIEPAVDIAAITVGAVASNQFLDLSKMFKTMDPEGFVIKHQGGLKAGAAVLSIMLWGKKMPRWMKMGIAGIGVAGAIKEVKVLTGGKIESIGSDNSGSDTNSLDLLLQEAARNSMNGGGGYGADPVSSVGAYDSGAGVGQMPDIPQMDYGTTVGWVG